MNELIPIHRRMFDNQGVQTVNARDLHAFLDIKSKFADWIRNRIRDYGFSEGVDFVIVSEILETSAGGGTTRQEYYLSLDMGKELAMVERTAKGKLARLYFLECERRAKAGPANIFEAVVADPSGAAKAIEALSKYGEQQKLRGDRFELLAVTYQSKADQAEEHIEHLAGTIEELKPAAAALDRISASSKTIIPRAAAKTLGLGPKEFTDWMRTNGWTYRSSDGDLPYQDKVNAGLLQLKYYDYKQDEYYAENGPKRRPQVVITGKGMAKLSKIFASAAV